MLEKMGEFFDARLQGYEDHQMTTIESAEDISTDAIREAVIAAILEAQEEPAP